MASFARRHPVTAGWRQPLQVRAGGAHAPRPSPPEQEEVYVVAGGSGRLKLDDEIIDVVEWDIIRVAPDVMRAFEAGPDGLDLVCVGA